VFCLIAMMTLVSTFAFRRLSSRAGETLLAREVD
jgi:hypothetical protein